MSWKKKYERLKTMLHWTHYTTAYITNPFLTCWEKSITFNFKFCLPFLIWKSVYICRIFFCHIVIIFMTFCVYTIFLDLPFNKIEVRPKYISSIIDNALYIILTSDIKFNLYKFSLSHTSNNWLLSAFLTAF